MNRVYVDDAALPLGQYVMYHMFSPDLGALHAMAGQIGIDRKWFQNPATMTNVSWPHYDIPQGRRDLAVYYGAIEVDRYQLVAMAGVILGKEDPLQLFRSDYYADQCDRLTVWLTEQGFPL